MKVSRKAKEKTRLKLLKSAVDVIIEKGFKNASMREIAKKAGVSDPTIYNYFPTKENILYEYLKQKHKETIEVLQNIDDFDSFSLREQLQTMLESELDLYLQDREFIIEIFDLAFYSSSVKIDSLYNTKELFILMVEDMFNNAIEAGEIEAQPFGDYLPILFWDYFIAVVAYWIKDDSDEFENTTEFIDHSMGILEALILSNVLSKVADLGQFMFKTHIINNLANFSSKKSKMKNIKKKFMEIIDE